MRGWVDFLFYRGLIVVAFCILMAWLAQDALARRRRARARREI